MCVPIPWNKHKLPVPFCPLECQPGGARRRCGCAGVPGLREADFHLLCFSQAVHTDHPMYLPPQACAPLQGACPQQRGPCQALCSGAKSASVLLLLPPCVAGAKGAGMAGNEDAGFFDGGLKRQPWRTLAR
ncbi:hypothetical protein BDY21DRAFT_340841 [Lineolata rhizophorae]|uniref:Uncharacterized protein n=1 Tax=Lineolata rhizophorae TaxID=578093 RepID=A0A6A6P4G1_9PEZI|nr:hypothetical protein BDY21DRAFT_340841 [Lineolata rhizophorae]